MTEGIIIGAIAVLVVAAIVITLKVRKRNKK
jgi:hypothetical protein